MKQTDILKVEAYLHQHIPLSKAMGVCVLSAGPEGVRLQAPLEPNLNHRGTAFGGSVSTLGILSAWTYLHGLLLGTGTPHRIVIQKNNVDYLLPIESAFEAFCPPPSSAVLDKFLSILEKRKKARITLKAVLSCGHVEVARFSGDYVAMKLES